MLLTAWVKAERDKRHVVAAAVESHFAERGPSGCQINTPEPIWEFLQWLAPEAFAKAKAILDNPEVATVDQVREALALLAAFFGQASKQDNDANSFFVRLESIYRDKLHPKMKNGL